YNLPAYELSQPQSPRAAEPCAIAARAVCAAPRAQKLSPPRLSCELPHPEKWCEPEERTAFQRAFDFPADWRKWRRQRALLLPATGNERRFLLPVRLAAQL